MEFSVEDNRLVVVPQKMVPADQAYYWSPEWQEGVNEAKEDLRVGRVEGPFDDVEDALRALKKPPKRRP